MSKAWWKAASIRSLRTFSQTAVSLITVGSAMSDVDWLTVGSVSLVAAILSILTSLSGLPEVKE